MTTRERLVAIIDESGGMLRHCDERTSKALKSFYNALFMLADSIDGKTEEIRGNQEKVSPNFKIEKGKMYRCIHSIDTFEKDHIYQSYEDGWIKNDDDNHVIAYPKYFCPVSEEKPESVFEAAIQPGDKIVFNKDMGCRVNLSQLNRVAKKEPRQENSPVLSNSSNTGRNEQKPADKVEPKFKIKYAGSEYNVFEVKDIAGVTFYGVEDEPNHIDYVKADNCEIISGGYGVKENGSPYPIKPAVFSEQKPVEASDLRTWKYIVDAVLTERNGIGQYIDSPWTEDMAKKLQERFGTIEQNPTWSEEDEKMLKELVRFIPLHLTSYSYKEYYNWAVSHRPQKQWKPTDEQMRVLDLAIRCGINRYTTEETTLVSLFNELKKLKED